MHNHTLRHYTSVALGLTAAVIVLQWAGAPPPKDLELAPVTGQVTYAHLPAVGMVVFFEPVDDKHRFAVGRVQADGSFRHLYTNSSLRYEGVMPGRYRVFFSPLGPVVSAPSMDRKYLTPGTSDLLVDVERDWNYVTLALH
jgi:hypothetical protein